MCCTDCHKWAHTLLDKLCRVCFAKAHPDEDFDTEVNKTPQAARGDGYTTTSGRKSTTIVLPIKRPNP